ncbi:MAG: NAD-dependent epimerase/dehydratase family protein [Planctomycetes bacterium]|nr:NAD-dependent epimerase/dehydratase family protein [Planctomycetota bacterium]
MSGEAPVAWVLGAGGLLGSHLRAALGRASPAVRLWTPQASSFSWKDPAALRGQLTAAVAEFARGVAGHASWMILWAAGMGVTGTSEQALQGETTTWRVFLDLVQEFLSGCRCPQPGMIFLASSAGGVYGDGPHLPLTEESPARPISPYGRAKLGQETILQEWAPSQPGTSYLIGRISNLYGRGQNLAKAQGFLSQISRCLVYQQPIHLYVPLDTIRDYIPAEACAEHIVRCLNFLSARGPGLGKGGHVKIFASEQETSLAQIIATFARVSRKRPRLICSPSPAGALQPRCLKFRSQLWPELGPPTGYGLQAGIHQLHQHYLALFLQGRLPPPENLRPATGVSAHREGHPDQTSGGAKKLSTGT